MFSACAVLPDHNHPLSCLNLRALAHFPACHVRKVRRRWERERVLDELAFYLSPLYFRLEPTHGENVRGLGHLLTRHPPHDVARPLAISEGAFCRALLTPQ